MYVYIQSQHIICMYVCFYLLLLSDRTHASYLRLKSSRPLTSLALQRREMSKNQGIHLFADYDFDGKPSQPDYGPGFTVHNSKNNKFYPTREAPASAALQKNPNDDKLTADVHKSCSRLHKQADPVPRQAANVRARSKRASQKGLPYTPRTSDAQKSSCPLTSSAQLSLVLQRDIRCKRWDPKVHKKPASKKDEKVAQNQRRQVSNVRARSENASQKGLPPRTSDAKLKKMAAAMVNKIRKKPAGNSAYAPGTSDAELKRMAAAVVHKIRKRPAGNSAGAIHMAGIRSAKLFQTKLKQMRNVRTRAKTALQQGRSYTPATKNVSLMRLAADVCASNKKADTAIEKADNADKKSDVATIDVPAA